MMQLLTVLAPLVYIVSSLCYTFTGYNYQEQFHCRRIAMILLDVKLEMYDLILDFLPEKAGIIGRGERSFMMFIDKKGKIFGVINIIDLFVVLAVVLLGVGYLYRDHGSEIQVGSGKSVTVKLVCNYAFPGAEESLRVGDHLVASSSLTGAVIKDIKVEQANETAPDDKGQMVLSKNPFRKDIYLTIEATDAQISPAEIIVAGQKCRAGKEDFFVKTQTVELKATVLDVEVN